MSWFEDNKSVLMFGAELEAVGERESAENVYLIYVKNAAKISEYEDALEMIYGRNVYSIGISDYAQAMDYATIAFCAKSLIILARNKFSTSDCWETVSKNEPQNKQLLDFFSWLTERRRVDIKHYEILKQAQRTLNENSKLVVSASDSVLRGGLVEVILDIVNDKIKVSDKGLR